LPTPEPFKAPLGVAAIGGIRSHAAPEHYR
jgi:hypothetical protein